MNGYMESMLYRQSDDTRMQYEHQTDNVLVSSFITTPYTKVILQE